jgi:hypothetical protein
MQLEIRSGFSEKFQKSKIDRANEINNCIYAQDVKNNKSVAES